MQQKGEAKISLQTQTKLVEQLQDSSRNVNLNKLYDILGVATLQIKLD